MTGFGFANQIPTFGGGIVNNGTINGNTNGINLQYVSNFSGGIANAGTIAVVSTPGPLAAPGINVAGLSTFTGGINNSGTISSLSPNGVGIMVAGIPFARQCSLEFQRRHHQQRHHQCQPVRHHARRGRYFALRRWHHQQRQHHRAVWYCLWRRYRHLLGRDFQFRQHHGYRRHRHRCAFGANAITINQSAGTVTGAILLSTHGDILNVSGGAIAGNIVGLGATDSINFALGANTFTYGAAYGFSGINQVNVNSGTVVLNGTNSATNVAVSGGNLQVGDAANAAASLTGTVGVTGGTLSGHGTVIGGVTIGNGGTLAPGGSIGTLTIQGNLAFAAAASYMVEISAVGSSSTSVTGTAALGGTVRVTSPTNTYRFNSPYTILTSAGLGGTQFGGLVLPSGMVGSLIYPNGNDVQLTLTSNLRQLARDERQPAQRRDERSIPHSTGEARPARLAGSFSATSSKSDAGLRRTRNRLAADDLRCDEPVHGPADRSLCRRPRQRRERRGGRDAVRGRSRQRERLRRQRQGAHQKRTRRLWHDYQSAADGRQLHSSAGAYGRRAYGGSQTTDGNATLGSNSTTSSIAGTAVGADYRFSPFTIAGFALAGGGTNFSVNGLGSGRSDLFQAGAYIRHTAGAAYSRRRWLMAGRTSRPIAWSPLPASIACMRNSTPTRSPAALKVAIAL